ncbi:MAG: TIGR02301 family protein [Hyphomicrobiales bacterium]|nr:TIGR02301 family protein [Hyphomicrobiales bacterium]
MAALVLVLVTMLGFALGAAAQTESPTGAPAQESESLPPPEPLPPVYEDRLLRLSEILGGLHFLRQLCGFEDGAAWRAEMAGLLDSEKPGPVRRARLVSRFNHGFETYYAVYRTCTPSARRAIALYLAEGRRITNDIRARYGQ